jgi:hypothetical protein
MLYIFPLEDKQAPKESTITDQVISITLALI